MKRIVGPFHFFNFKHQLMVRFQNRPLTPLQELHSLPSPYGQMLCQFLAWSWPTRLVPLPQSNPHFSWKLEHPDWIPAKNLKKAIFYAGTFNPWHQGHLQCLKSFPIKRQLILLPDRNPWKENPSSEEECPWQKFLQLRKLTERNTRYIYPGFLASLEKNPTINWVKKRPEKTSLLMGLDSFLSLPKWHMAHQLIHHLCNLYVVDRLSPSGSMASRDEVETWMKNQNETLKIFYFQKNPYTSLSSTELRAEGKKI